MSNREPNKNGLFITVGLLILSLVVTIWLFFYLSNPQARSETFGFTLFFVCFLEFLFFGYFIVLFILGLRKRIVVAIYPSIGFIISLYILVSVIIIIAHNLLSIWVKSPKAYFVVLSIETLIFLIILSSIIVLNKYKKGEDIQTEAEKTELTNLSVKMQEIYQNFTNCKSYFELQAYRNVERDMRKLKEKFQFCTPFGRSVPEVEEIEKQIEDKILSLGKLINDIPAMPKEELAKRLENIKSLITSIIQAMERREKLLIK